MARITGINGQVKIGSNILGSVVSFEFTEETPINAQPLLNSYADEKVQSGYNWTGSVEIYWDKSDTAQTALKTASDGKVTQLDVVFYPEGVKSGNVQYTGKAILTSKPKNVTRDGYISSTLSLEGIGFLAETTQT